MSKKSKSFSKHIGLIKKLWVMLIKYRHQIFPEKKKSYCGGEYENKFRY